MIRKPIILSLIIGVIVCLLLLVQFAYVFQRNHVTFLLNQKEYERAEELVDRLAKARPDDDHVEFLRTKTYALVGRLDAASHTTISLSLKEDHPEVLYWKGLAQWQSGREAEALGTIQQYEELNAKPNHSYVKPIVQMMLGRQTLASLASVHSKSFQLLFPLEQSVYMGLLADQEVQRGNLTDANELFAHSFALGNRNPRILVSAGKSALLGGDEHHARMYIDYAALNSIEPLCEELSKAYDEHKSLVVSTHEIDRSGTRDRLQLAYALSWLSLRLLEEDESRHRYPVLRTIAELQQDFPYDRILYYRLADVLEQLKRYDEAYSNLKKLYTDSPSLEIGLQMWSLEGVSSEVMDRNIEEFLQKVPMVEHIETAEWLIAEGESRTDDHYLSFGENCHLEQSVKVKEDGVYMFTLIAKSDAAAKMRPLIRLSTGDEFRGFLYVDRANWSCYSLTVYLEAGEHRIVLDYANATEGLVDGSEVRSLYVRDGYFTESRVKQ